MARFARRFLGLDWPTETIRRSIRITALQLLGFATIGGLQLEPRGHPDWQDFFEVMYVLLGILGVVDLALKVRELHRREGGTNDPAEVDSSATVEDA